MPFPANCDVYFPLSHYSLMFLIEVFCIFLLLFCLREYLQQCVIACHMVIIIIIIIVVTCKVPLQELSSIVQKYN